MDALKPRPVKDSALIYWVREREAMRIRKDVLVADDVLFWRPHSWSLDSILAQYRFCNVRRRHDRVSQWLLKHVLTRANYESQGAYRFALFSGFCRWVNWPPSLQAVLDRVGWPGMDDYPKAGAVLDEMQERGEKVWTGAYMIKSSQAYKGKSKADFIVNEVMLKGLIPNASRIIGVMTDTRSKQAAWQELTKVKDFGSFMAGQVVDDWSWTPLFGEGAVDDKTWAPFGPGSIRGLNRLLGREPIRTPFKSEEWQAHLRDIRADIVNRLGPSFDDMSLMDVQNCLCECDKFMRVKNGEGRPRSRYRPETAF